MNSGQLDDKQEVEPQHRVEIEAQWLLGKPKYP